MSQAAVPDQLEIISDKCVALSGNEHPNVDDGEPVDGWYRCWRHDVYRHPALEWTGPVAFVKAYGAVPGIEHDFGTRWGSNGDQRVGLRVEGDADAGLLYVYDPTWDEYAILGIELQLVAIEDAFARALRGVEHPVLEDFIALLQRVPAARPSPGPES